MRNIKIIVDNKAFDVDGYSQGRRVYFLLDGTEIGFDQVEKVLHGSAAAEYDYHKNNTAKEIFEGDTVKFFDEFNRILTGEVVWCAKRLQWIIECDTNIHGWKIHTLADAGLPTIIRRKYEDG